MDLQLIKLMLVLAVVNVLLVLLYLITNKGVPTEELGSLPALLNLDGEGNIPTWFASLLWASVGIAAIRNWAKERAHKIGLGFCWLLIGLIFLAASCDEVSQIHEELGMVLAKNAAPVAMEATRSPWIAYLAIPIAVAICGILVFLHLRLRRQQRLFLIAVGGFVLYAIAIALDYLQGLPTNAASTATLEASVVAEEFCENLGSLLLLFTFLSYQFEPNAAVVSARQ